MITKDYGPYINGLVAALIISALSIFLSSHYATPPMLFAILLGMSVNFLSRKITFEKGLSLASDSLLKLGVSLLGFRLSLATINDVGIPSLISIFILICCTILFGIIISRLLIKNLHFGFLSAASVAICGASAAVAIFSILPKKRIKNQELSLVIISVTLLSTIAMIFYPMLFKLLDAQANEMGYLIGATIHDVAQVIGAGYSVSEDTGIIATFVKMVRVSFLPVLIIFLIIMTKPSEGKMPTLPWFLILFFIFALIRNVISLPTDLINLLNLISTWLILVAISAVGMKTNFSLATEIGFKYFLIILLETFFLLLSAILMVWLFRLLDS